MSACPEKCSGYRAPKEIENTELVELPEGLRERVRGKKLLLCGYCGCVWFMDSLGPIQSVPVILGQYDGIYSANRFVARA